MRVSLLPTILIAFVLVGCQQSADSGQTVASTDVGNKGAQDVPAPAAPPGPVAPPVHHDSRGGSESSARSPATGIKDSVKAKDSSVIEQKLTKSQMDSMKAAIAAEKMATQQRLAIPANNSGDWGPTSVSAHEIAVKMAAALKQLRDTMADIDCVIQSPGGTGTSGLKLAIVDSTHYSIPFLDTKTNGDGLIVANGKVKMEKLDVNWQPPVPVSKPLADAIRSPSEMLSSFSGDCTRMAFQGLTDGRDAWVPVMDQLSQGRDGFSTTVEERRLPVEGHPGKFFDDFRVHAARKGSNGSKNEIEVVVDGYKFLPVTVRTSYTTPAGHTWKIMWAASYHFNPKGGIPPDAIKAPWNMKPHKA